MPDPNAVSQGANGGRVNLQDAPLGDLSFDSLFPNPELNNPPQATSQPGTPPAEAQPFLKAGDSIYKTAEDAANGIAHKDSLVAKYRDFLTKNGVDPNTMEFVAQPPASQAPAPAAPASQYKYLNNGTQLYKDLAAAANPANPNMVEYERIMQTYQREMFQDSFAPYQSLVAESSRNQAIRKVSEEIPDFGNFANSAEFKKTVDSIPLYKEMISIGESDPSAAKRLPEVYRAIYFTSKGLNPQVQNAQAPQAPVQTPQATRPPGTMSPSTMTPPQQGVDTRSWATSRESRKQLIADAEARGVLDTNWSLVGT